MTGLAFKNNAKTTLSSGVNDSTTTIPVTEGSVFPQIDATDPALDVFFFVTLDDDTNNEIVKVTASTGSSGNQNLTVVRAQEGTTARAFSSGDKVELRLTAGMVDTFNLSGNDITLSNNKMGFGDSTPEVSLDLGSQTDSLHVPVGTTAQRPGSPEAGYLRYNSTTGKFEGYTNAWGDLADGSDFLVTNIYTTANASTTDFTISNAVQDEKQLLVFIDGVFQAHNSYSVSGTTVTLSTAPASGREVTIYSALSNLQGANMVIATMTGDNSDTTLDLGVTPVSENNVQVYFDGVYQHKSTFSISGQILTFSTAPPTGTAVEAITHTVLDISAAASSVLIDEFTGNGSTTAFTLAAAPANENNTQVYVGGVYQEKATYSVSGTTLTLTEAPANGVSVEVMSIAVGQINSAIQLSDADGDTQIQVEESSDEDKIRFDTGGSERMILDDNGKLIIGDSASHVDDLLQIETPASGGGHGIQIRRNDSNTDQGIGRILFGNNTDTDLATVAAKTDGATDSAALQFSTQKTGGSSTERLRISGNNLHLNGGTDARIQLGTGGAGANQVSNNTVHIRGDGTSMKLMAASGGSYLFETNGTAVFQIDSAGHVTKPLQSGFSVKFSSNSDVDFTTTGYTTIPFNSERWDNNGDFNTSTYTFTAPVTGKYLFNYSLGVNSMDNSNTWFVILINTSNHSYHHWIAPDDMFTGGDLNGNFTMKTSAVADMDANDTCYARAYIYNGTASQFTYIGDNRVSYMTGYLLG